MAFIKATWAMNGAEIAINIDNIVAVTDNAGQAIVQTAAPANNGSLQYWLKDSYSTIINKIEVAADNTMV